MTRRAPRAVRIGLLAAAVLCGQRAKNSARDLFHAEAGLIVTPGSAGRGRFGGARQSTVALSLGLKYRLWKVAGSETSDADPAGPFQPGEQVRLGVETNDSGYLYIVHRQPGGSWRRLFPTSEIEGGNHFIRSGVVYPVPPEEGVELQFNGGPERILLVLARAPVQHLEALVGPRQAPGTVSAAPAPELPDSVVESVRKLVPGKDLLTQREAGEKSTYVVNRSGKPDSTVLAEVRISSR